MRIKLDENLPLSVAAVLVERGHDVDTVSDEGLTGASDPEVVEASTADGRLLITLDVGLADIRLYPPGSHAGILVIRLADQSPTSIREALLGAVENYDLTALAGTVAVLQRDLLRIRRPYSS